MSASATAWVIFSLCLLGTILTWVVIWGVFLSREFAILPIAAGFGISMLELGWMLGMIWDMVPQRYPLSFCRAQGILISYGAFQIASVFGTMGFSVFLNLLQPRETRSLNPIRVRPSLYPILFGHPLVGTLLFSSVGVTKDAFKPSWLICDATDPPWTRLLSYAGWDWIVMGPTILICFFALFRLEQLKRHVRKVYAPRRISGEVNQTGSHSPSRMDRTSFPPPRLGSPGAADEEDRKSTMAMEISSSTSSTFPLVDIRRPQGISQRIMEVSGLEEIVWGGRTVHASQSLKQQRAIQEAEERQRDQTQHDEESKMANSVEVEWISALNSASIRVITLLVMAVAVQLFGCISPFSYLARGKVVDQFGSEHLAGVLAGFAPPGVLMITPDFREYIIRQYRIHILHRSPPPPEMHHHPT